MDPDQYHTLPVNASGIYKDRGSKFIALGTSVSSPEAAQEFLQAVKKEHPKARHHCFAYRIGLNGETFRENDDGEPSGTAGKPIFGQLESANVTNAIIVVVRYFGGKLLGTSGLIKAYRGAAADLLNQTSFVVKTVNDYWQIEAPYTQINDVLNLIKQPEIELVEESYTDIGRWIAGFRQRDALLLTEQLKELPDVTVSYLYSQ